jgi:hypothetical protein
MTTAVSDSPSEVELPMIFPLPDPTDVLCTFKFLSVQYMCGVSTALSQWSHLVANFGFRQLLALLFW